MYAEYKQILEMHGIDTARLGHTIKSCPARNFPHNRIENESMYIKAEYNCRAQLTIVAVKELYRDWLMDNFQNRVVNEENHALTPLLDNCNLERRMILAHALRFETSLTVATAIRVLDLFKKTEQLFVDATKTVSHNFLPDIRMCSRIFFFFCVFFSRHRKHGIADVHLKEVLLGIFEHIIIATFITWFGLYSREYHS